jgi:hypothetical protein
VGGEGGQSQPQRRLPDGRSRASPANELCETELPLSRLLGIINQTVGGRMLEALSVARLGPEDPRPAKLQPEAT